METDHVSRGSTQSTRFELPEKRNDWVNTKTNYSNSKLSVLGQPVMQDWEEPYMSELAKIATRNGGDVLEVGFGMGISASSIQSNRIYRHFIVEPNYEVFLQLLEFSKTAPHTVIPIFGFWQDVVGQLQAGSFDGILFDCCATDVDDYYKTEFDFAFQAYRLLKSCGVFTHYINQDYADDEYVQMIHRVGFRSCKGYTVNVNPPPSCEYWKKKQIFAPVILK